MCLSLFYNLEIHLENRMIFWVAFQIMVALKYFCEVYYRCLLVEYWILCLPIYVGLFSSFEVWCRGMWKLSAWQVSWLWMSWPRCRCSLSQNIHYFVLNVQSNYCFYFMSKKLFLQLELLAVEELISTISVKFIT